MSLPALLIIATLLALAALLYARGQRSVRAAQVSQAMLDHSPHLIGLLSPDGRLLRTNQSATEWLGPDAAELTGRPLWDIPRWVLSPNDTIAIGILHGADCACGAPFFRKRGTRISSPCIAPGAK